MTGYVHSIQSLGAVDGPGVRYVVFMQGCPLRCVYCHNPDTWLTEGGEEYTADELVRKALRFRPYWRNGGGVTVTGGEPLLQAAFVEEFFASCTNTAYTPRSIPRAWATSRRPNACCGTPILCCAT